MDTVGEFIRALEGAGFPFPKAPILAKLRLIGRMREFANRISNGPENWNKPLMRPISVV
jgi:hypothetical protein